jgi:anti-sigma regulatory factor (Ser/Thr protein kinase)
VPTAEVHVTAEYRSAGVARRFLRATLDDWDAAGFTDNAELILTELVTNAILHAKTEIVIRVDLGARALRLEVADGSPRQPIARHYSAEATTGRGLGLVDALAERWGVQPGADGKTVWAELALDQPARQGSPETDATEVRQWPGSGHTVAKRSSSLDSSLRCTQPVSTRAA